jgi:hypothetical protein
MLQFTVILLWLLNAYLPRLSANDSSIAESRGKTELPPPVPKLDAEEGVESLPGGDDDDAVARRSRTPALNLSHLSFHADILRS